jgi:hypothetical protein
MSWPSTPLLSSGPPFLSEGSGVGRSIQQQILSCNKTRSRTAQKSTGSAKFFRRPKAPRRDLIEDGLLRLFDILSGLLGDGVCGSTEAVTTIGSRSCSESILLSPAGAGGGAKTRRSMWGERECANFVLFFRRMAGRQLHPFFIICVQELIALRAYC